MSGLSSAQARETPDFKALVERFNSGGMSPILAILAPLIAVKAARMFVRMVQTPAQRRAKLFKAPRNSVKRWKAGRFGLGGRP